MKQSRGSLYLLTGLLLGIGLGLFYAWVIHPVDVAELAPSNLQITAKDNYRALIATAFISSGDLVRAKARLSLLEDPDPFQQVVEQAERMAVFGETGEVTALRLLAIALSRDAELISPDDNSGQSP